MASKTAAVQSLGVLSVASEMYPLVKTGGLADVAGALPVALTAHGVEMRTLLPGYPQVLAQLQGGRTVATWRSWFGGGARLLSGNAGAAQLLVLDSPHLYARPGGPYLDADGQDWSDNAQRFAALACAAAHLGCGALAGYAPDVIHTHDWQAALVPAYLRYTGTAGQPRPPTVLTLHNVAFQGRFGRNVWPHLGLPDAAFTPQGLEYWGDVGFLKGGILLADAITTVSPTYVHETLTPEGGMGLDAMLRWRASQGAFTGIVNGIDTEVWNPATDVLLQQNFDHRSLANRLDNKRAVQAAFGLDALDKPLVCMVTRLTTQKGIDLVTQALDQLMALGIQLAVLGTGDADLEQALEHATKRYAGRVGVMLRYAEPVAHLLQGGSDAILVPSRFEPCGLTQLYGLRYGCVPVVSRVGGLADTVIDANEAAVRAGVATGLQFADISVAGIVGALQRMVTLYAEPKIWKRLQTAGMVADVGWQASAAQYAALYRRLIQLRNQP